MVSTPFVAFVIFFVNISSCLCAIFPSNSTFASKMFSAGLATWYGDETGAGSGNAMKVSR